MTRRGWLLFAAMSVIWGIPYLLIKVAVREVSPPVLVATRTGLAAAVLVPLAWRRGVLRPAWQKWRPLLAFSAMEMAWPWLLLADAERHLPSGLTGLLIATVPLIGAIVGLLLGDRTVLRPVRLGGLLVGFLGVVLIVGFGDAGGSVHPFNVLEVLVVTVGYATAPFVAARGLADVPSLGVVASSLGVVFVGYLPAAVVWRPDHVPSAQVLWSLVGLASICTGLAFLVFFALIDEVGPARATLFTFVNPAVAVVLGVLVLDESLTAGLLAGFPLVLAGCWLAGRERELVDEAAVTVS